MATGRWVLLVLLLTICPLPAGASPPPPGPPATSVFGPRPEYTPGISPTMVVDEFGLIDATLTNQHATEIAKTIGEWKNQGIGYGAYYDFFGTQYDNVAGARVDLDGTPISSTGASGNPAYWGSPTRAAFRQWLIDSADRAIDLGATHIILDSASIDFSTWSFDSEVVAAFATYIGDPTFDIAAYLRGLGYSTIQDLETAVGNGDPNLVGDAYWQAWVAFSPVLDRQIFSELSSALHAHAAAQSTQVYLTANRSIHGTDVWRIGDLLDYTGSEAFIDNIDYPSQDLAFEYKTAVAFGRRFWSWDFPNNQASLNGTNDPWAQAPCNNLDRLFVAQTFANGGLSQVCGAGWVYFEDYGYVPDLVAPMYDLVAAHAELFDHPEAGEIALLYSEPWARFNPTAADTAFRGASDLLSDAHRPWDVVFASDPNARDGSEQLSLAELTPYKAVVLPRTRGLSDAQISILEQYLDAGGTVIGFGPVGDLDENGNDVSASRTFDDLFTTRQTDTTTYAGTVIAFGGDPGTVDYNNVSDWTFRASKVTLFQSLVDSVVPPEVQTDLPMTVDITRFTDTSDGSQIYHLINRDYDSTAGAVTTVPAGSTFTVPVPAGMSGTPTVSFVQPGHLDPQVLAASVSAGQATVSLPSLDEWTILKVGSVIPSATPVDRAPWSMVHTIDNLLTSVDDAVATGGHRPDEVDTSGQIVAPYWYWKGGNFGTVPFPIAFLATDDVGLSSIDLFYRYSPDGVTFGSWSQYGSQSLSGSGRTDIDLFDFDAPDGEGYYQMYFRAHDTAGQTEEVLPGAETGYGVDWTPPGPPAFSEIHGVESGQWQQITDTPVFTWTAPSDNLSGPGGGNLQLMSVATGFTLATCNVPDLTVAAQWNPADGTTCPGGAGMVTSGPLSPGQYFVTAQVEDVAGNPSQDYRVFDFYYGPLAVDDVQNLTVIPGDGTLTVTWNAPADPRYANASVFIRPDDPAASWITAGVTMNVSQTTLAVPATNGVAYQVMVVAQTATQQPGNEVPAPCIYTPGTSPITDCGGGGGSADAGVPDAGTGGGLDAGVPDAGTGGGLDAGGYDAGTGGGLDAGGYDAGTGGGQDAGVPPGGDAGIPPGGDAGTGMPSTPGGSGGCGCVVAPGASGSPAGALVLGGLLLLAWRRRRGNYGE